MTSVLSSIDGINVAALGGLGTTNLHRTAIAFLPVTIVTVAIRVYVRIAIVQAFGWDDAILLVSLGFFLVFCAFVIKIVDMENDPSILVKFASGEQGILEVLNAVYMNGIFFVMFYVLAVIFLKLSLAIFFLRIIVRQWQRVVILTTTALFTTFGSAFCFIYMFQCGLNLKNEIAAEMARKCLSIEVLTFLTYTYGSLDMATDAVYALLPIALLWNSNMPRTMKLTSGLLLTKGSVSCICAIATNTGLMSVLEPGLGLVATSLAACRPLWRKLFEVNSVSSFFRQSIGKTTTGSSQSCSGKHSSRQGPLKYVERSEGLKGFKKFNDADYGLTTTTVVAGGTKSEASTELQDLGSLEAQDIEAQDNYTQEDKSSLSLVRQPRSISEEHLRAGITRRYDVCVE